jgi:demethylmenaquinone methyltransferase/2-methoxy-6-polyprenyl-1,4-benzoquinol methylase
MAPSSPGVDDLGAAMSDRTDFGYRSVPRAEKARLVRGVFESVAPRYDLMNDLMSLGVHRVWKRIFANAIGASPRETLLDLAAGTGDVAFLVKQHGADRVILSDINPAMLARAQGRALDRGLAAGLHFLCADAERLPLPDRSVEKVSMAFGLRNCTDKAATLREARRVLRPGGRFHCLEFSRVGVEGLAQLYDLWSFRVLPRLGAGVAGDADSYRYLAESIRTFPDQESLAEMLQGAGFDRVAWRNLSGGIVAIHTGWRL